MKYIHPISPDYTDGSSVTYLDSISHLENGLMLLAPYEDTNQINDFRIELNENPLTTPAERDLWVLVERYYDGKTRFYSDKIEQLRSWMQNIINENV